MTRLDQLKADLDAEKEKNIELEKAINRQSHNAGGDISPLFEWSKSMNKYLRYVETPSQDIIDKTGSLFAKMIGGEEKGKLLEAFKEMNKGNGGYYAFTPNEYDKLKSMLVGSNPDGGYFTMPERSSTQVTRDFETSPIRTVASVVSGISDRLELIINDDESASGGWVSEVEDRPESDTAKIGKLTIHAHEQYAKPRVTQMLLDDAAINIEQWLNEKTMDIIARTENTAFMTGNGSGKPYGILNYPAWTTNTTSDLTTEGTYERGKLEQVNSGTSAVFTYDGLIALQTSLKEMYQANAIFALKRISWGQIRQLKDSEGRSLLDFDTLREGNVLRLLGKPVIFMDDVQAPAANSLSAIYGDFRLGYTIYDRMGMRTLRDPFSGKPYVEFYTIKRTGGAVTNYECLKIQKLAV